MKYTNTLEIKEQRSKLVHRNMQILRACKDEERELTAEEEEEMNKNEEELKELEENEKEVEDKLNEETPAPAADDEENKNKRNKNTMKTIISEIRSAMENGSNKFTLNTEERAATVGGYTTGTSPNEVQHNTTVVEQEVKPILEPLYPNSILNQIGATVYNGLPMGDIVVPVMSKNTAAWAGETAQASGTQNDFSTVTLQPKRLTAVVEISKMLIAQDTVGVENAIRADIVKAMNNKLEATIFSADASSATKPAGLFYGATETTISTFGDVCNLEAELDDKGVNGEMKYLLNTKVKAYLRQLAKSSKVTELVYQAGEVDGTPAIASAIVPSKKFAYGNFADFVVGLWDNVEVVVDPYSTAANGTIRLIVNMYADAKLARTDAIKFGNIA